MQTLSRGTARLLVLAGVLLARPPAWAATPPEKTLPGTTIGFIKIANAASFREALKESRFGTMLADPAMAPVLEDSGTRVDGRAPRLGPNTRKTLRQLWDLAEGEMSLAILPAKDAKMPYALFLTVDGGKNAKAMQEAMVNATKQAAQNGDKITTETFKSMTLTVIRPGTVQPGRAAPLAVWTNVGGVFYVGAAVNIAPIKDVLANLNGRPESLGDSEPYQTVARRLGPAAPMTWFVTGGPMLEFISDLAAQQGMDKEEIAAQLELLGLNAVLGIGGTYTLNVGEFDTVAKIFMYAPGQLPGLLRLFKFQKAAMRPEPWVPASVASYRTMNFNFDNAYIALDEFANQLVPGLLENLQQQLAAPNGKKLDLKKQLFAPMGNRVTMISDFKKPITGDSQRTLYAVPLDDPKTLQATLNTMFEVLELKPKKREFQGVTIHAVDLSGVADAQGAPAPGEPIHVAISQGTLFVSMEPTLLEQVLRPGGPPLADSPAFQAIAKHLPPESVSIAYIKGDEQARNTYERIKTGQIQEDIDMFFPEGVGPRIADFINPAKLPDFSVVAKHMLPGGGYTQTDDEGAMITQFTIRAVNP